MVRILLFVALILLQRYGRDSLRSAVFACLCVWSSYEAVCALMQVAGLSASHHAAFAMTGNFSNPGPLGGFVAVSLAVSLSYLVKNTAGGIKGGIAVRCMRLLRFPPFSDSWCCPHP